MPDSSKRRDTVPGQWYLWAQCRSCNGEIAISQLNNDPPVQVQADSVFVFESVTCPHCEAVDRYAMRELRHLPARLDLADRARHPVDAGTEARP